MYVFSTPGVRESRLARRPVGKAMFRFARCFVYLLLFTARCTRAELRPQSELSSNCFDFPANNFDVANSIFGVHGNSPHFLLKRGQEAIDFTLHDVHGKPWNLGDALKNGLPVVMIWGMLTCPAWQGMGTSPPWEKSSYRDEHDLVSLNSIFCLYVAFSTRFGCTDSS